MRPPLVVGDAPLALLLTLPKEEYSSVLHPHLLQLTASVGGLVWCVLKSSTRPPLLPVPPWRGGMRRVCDDDGVQHW